MVEKEELQLNHLRKSGVIGEEVDSVGGEVQFPQGWAHVHDVAKITGHNVIPVQEEGLELVTAGEYFEDLFDALIF